MQFLRIKSLSNTESELAITWHDDVQCSYNLLELRKACPCATCRGGHEINSIRTTDHIKSIAMSGWKKVGRYAIQISWSDGHDLGIYTLDHLREKCEAAATNTANSN